MYEDFDRSLRNVAYDEDGGALSAVFSFESTERFFSGHFPGRPLVPAVFQIEIVRAALDAATGGRHVIERVEHARFVREIGPGDEVEIEASVNRGGERISLQATLRVGEETAAVISLVAVRAP